MSAPTSHDPLVVNTRDGMCWKRQHVDGDGRGLYALADVTACPAYVLSSFGELAERGIVGSADVLPVPVGPEPQEADADTVAARAAQVIGSMGAELRGLKKESDRLFLAWGSARMRSRRKNEALKKLRARVTELEAERHSTNEALDDAVQALRARPKTAFRASHDSILMGHYTTREAAQAHCEAKVQEEEPEGSILHLSWSADDIGPDAEYELHITPTRTGGLIRGTGYVVTPVEVASAYDPDADE